MRLASRKFLGTYGGAVLLGSFLFVLGGCARPQPTPPGDGPRLVLFLVVDQGRADYLVRYRPLLQHGLGRLLEESVAFTDAHHDHGMTTTAPGHATLATGRYPSHHGIIDNGWYDRDEGEQIVAVSDPEYEQSPRRLLSTTLGDWLKESSPLSKVFGASMKDRAAIFSSGHQADGAFWYSSRKGTFGSSPYYDEPEPPWLEAFSEEDYLKRYFGTLWEPLPEVAAEAASCDVEPLGRGLIDWQFPHPLGSYRLEATSSFYGAVYGSPLADRYLAELAKALIEGEDLGSDGDVDFLALSFSALDSVGHTFGPNSPEHMDTVLQLDRTLGDLLAFVDEKIGLEHVVVSFSADHGVAQVPEYRASKGLSGRRFGGEEIRCVQEVGNALRERFGDEDYFSATTYFDHDALAENGVDADEFAQALREGLESCPGFERVWTAAELLAGPEDGPGRLYAHSYHPERSGDVVLQLEPNTLSSRGSATTHGSPYSYDTHVPWLLRLPEGRHVEVGERVHTVDVAPTIARLLGLETPANLDGVDRGGLFAESP